MFISTSNHNKGAIKMKGDRVIIHFVSTSNHNSASESWSTPTVVIHFVSTSNHNWVKMHAQLAWL